MLGTNTKPEFIAYIFIQRYRYNQSFYKLEKKFKNIGLSITRQTLLNWTNRINKIYFSNKIESFDFFSTDEITLFYKLVKYMNFE